MSNDDRHELKAYLEGRDGVSAAYRQSAQEEPPAALDRLILDAARRQARPSADAWYAARKPYALAASVMLAVVALSLYLGSLDAVVLDREAAQAPTVATPVELQRVEREEPLPPRSAESQAAQQRSGFEARQLAPPVPTVGAADPPRALAPAGLATDSLAVGLQVEPPALVIDGPLLEGLEAEAERARSQTASAGAGRADAALEEIQVSGARIAPRRADADFAYRNSRDTWLATIRSMAEELDARANLVTARSSAALLQQELEQEIELFLQAYPDGDSDMEAALER